MLPVTPARRVVHTSALTWPADPSVVSIGGIAVAEFPVPARLTLSELGASLDKQWTVNGDHRRRHHGDNASSHSPTSAFGPVLRQMRHESPYSALDVVR